MDVYRKENRQVIEDLKTDIALGLSNEELKLRLNKFGLNKLPEVKPDGLFKIFFRQFQSPLIYLLLFASIVLFFLDDIVDALVILFILLFNAVLGTIQEGKAQNALEALKKFITSEALVLREGKEEVVLDEELVPGDIILLNDGDKVPADARLIYVNNFKVSESALTGESQPVSKITEVISGKNLSSSEQKNMVFKGTYVVSGNATAVVVATGVSTVVGNISVKLTSIDTDVPLKTKIKSLSRLIIGVVLIIAGAIFSLGIIVGNDPHDMILTVIAIVVSSIPEGLPVIITLVLATGVWRMSKRNALVKRLQAVEALGQAKVIAVDKTGTITRNELMVSRLFFDDMVFVVSGLGYESEGFIEDEEGRPYNSNTSEILKKIAEVSAFCSDARIRHNKEEDIWQVSGDPTEAAMRVLARKSGVSKTQMEKLSPRIFEIPFNSDNKYHVVINKHEDGTNFLSFVGAPEEVLKKTGHILKNNQVTPIDDEDRIKIEEKILEFSEEGLRVIGVAFSNDEVSDYYEEENLPPLVFVGLVAMSDVKRRGVKEAVRRVHEAGVNLVMITGDHKITACAIAKEVGIYSEGDRIVLGSELNEMTSEELAEALPNTTVFARVTPEHKLKIIEAYRSLDLVVAMTGDGVNDALSLVSADLGVAMGKIGTEVAKEASDIILLDDNFGSIISAMEEGRAIYRRIQQVILYLFSTSLGEILTISVAIIVGLPLPLLAAQIIWLNVITDGVLLAPLSMDPKEKDILKQKFEKPKKWVIDKLMAKRMILMGATMASVTLFLFYQYLPPSGELEGLVDKDLMRKPWTIALTMLAVFQWFNVWNVRTDVDSIFSRQLFSNKWLLVALISAVLLQITVVYVPFMQDIFRTTALTLSEWGLIVTLGLSIILVEEIRKLLVRLKRRSSRS